MDEHNLNIKKKRGRKPKNYIIQTQSEIQTEVQPDQEINNNDAIIKKRGRKSISKLINLENQPEEILNNCIIARLPLKAEDVQKILLENNNQINESNNNQPTCDISNEISKCIDFNDDIYEHKHKLLTCQKCMQYEEKIIELNNEIQSLKTGSIHISSNINKKIYESKVNFYDVNMSQWKDSTPIACWWCCHTFMNIPLGIPEYIIKDKFYLYGCFCSFNCMMAYNLDLNDYKIWDRQANIYQMKNVIDPDNIFTIHPAPPRQILEMFGGPLSIDDYRQSFFVINKEFKIYLPPMISIIGSIEENNRDMSNTHKINTNNHAFIKRKKPLPKHSNNLNMVVNKT